MLGDSPALSPDLGSNSELCLLLAVDLKQELKPLWASSVPSVNQG